MNEYFAQWQAERAHRVVDDAAILAQWSERYSAPVVPTTDTTWQRQGWPPPDHFAGPIPLKHRRVVMPRRDYSGLEGLKKGKAPDYPRPCAHTKTEHVYADWSYKNADRGKCKHHDCRRTINAAAFQQLYGKPLSSLRQRVEHVRARSGK